MTRDERARAAMDRLLEVVPPIMREIGYSQRTCVLQTRIATVVLREQGVRARPLACDLLVGNAAWLRLMGELGRYPNVNEFRGEEWTVGVAAENPDPAVPGYNGHVVTVVEEAHVLDLTVDQASRPQKGIVLTPVRWIAPGGFLTGEAPALFDVGGCLVKYDARPRDEDFMRAPDWTEPVKTGGRVARVNPLPRVRAAISQAA